MKEMSKVILGDKLRKLREGKGFPLRKVAAILDIDIAILSKMERGERRLTKEVVIKLASIYDYDLKELLVLYLSEKIITEVGQEEYALTAMKLAQEQMQNKTGKK